MTTAPQSILQSEQQVEVLCQCFDRFYEVTLILAHLIPALLARPRTASPPTPFSFPAPPKAACSRGWIASEIGTACSRLHLRPRLTASTSVPACSCRRPPPSPTAPASPPTPAQRRRILLLRPETEKLCHEEKKNAKLNKSLQLMQLKYASRENVFRTLQDKIRETEQEC